MYTPVDPRVDFPKMEEKIQKFWEENTIFEKSISNRDGAEDFVFYDGPPFATGLPHFGHFVPGTLKDIIPRYQTMKGKRVERRFGWDCHGLPVEYEMEKELGISGKTEIEKFGVAKFNEACRSIVLRYTGEWRQTITRMGRWVDFDHDYKTMDADYMESIWWVVKSLWEKELIYKGHYILPTCPRCSTPLSNHELNLGGYKDVNDPRHHHQVQDGQGREYILSGLDHHTLDPHLPTWPLTLGSEIDYVKVKDGDEFISLRLSGSPPITSRKKTTRSSGPKKEKTSPDSPMSRYFPTSWIEKTRELTKHSTGDHVSTEDGTGIVHTASGFGEEDYAVLKDTGIEVGLPCRR